MDVCLDIQPTLAQGAGVGRYTLELAAHLQPPVGDQLRFFCLNYRRLPLPPALCTPNSPATRDVRLPGRIVQHAWRLLSWPPYDSLAKHADVFHFPNFVAPPVRHGRIVVTVHDAAFLRFPETIEHANLRYLQHHLPSTLQRADAIITVSQFCADELHVLLDVPRAKLYVVPSGLSPHWVPARHEAVTEMRRRLDLPHPYLLTVGTLEPRKNLSGFLDIFESLASTKLMWVLAGRPGWKSDAFLRRLSNSPARNRIRLLLNVPEADLPLLYTGAEIFVFPSHYEGFGFPPLEALACGAPVIAGEVSCLPEILGDAAWLLPAESPDVWRNTITQLLADPAQRLARKEMGFAHAATFTWKRTARATWEVYHRVASA